MEILKVNGIKKTYASRFSGNKVEALKGVSFSVESGEYVAIMGESGSGKTTLLNILAALDRPTEGKVVLDGKELDTIKENELAAFRRENLGFVFQEFNLLDTFSVKDNILLPLVLSGKSIQEIKPWLSVISESLGISDLLEKYPYEISGGQKQRVAAARALITNPKLILADEPTGALDSRSSDDLLRIFSKINEGGQTILMVTHSVNAASHAGRVLFIRDGIVYHQIYRGGCGNEQMYQKISDTLTMLRTGERPAFTYTRGTMGAAPAAAPSQNAAQAAASSKNAASLNAAPSAASSHAASAQNASSQNASSQNETSWGGVRQ